MALPSIYTQVYGKIPEFLKKIGELNYERQFSKRFELSA